MKHSMAFLFCCFFDLQALTGHEHGMYTRNAITNSLANSKWSCRVYQYIVQLQWWHRTVCCHFRWFEICTVHKLSTKLFLHPHLKSIEANILTMFLEYSASFTQYSQIFSIREAV